MASQLNAGMSKKVAGVRLWELIGLVVGALIMIILSILLYLCLTARKKSRRTNNSLPLSQIPSISKDIREIRVDQVSQNRHASYPDGIKEKSNEKDSDRLLTHPSVEKLKNGENGSHSGSFTHIEKDGIGSPTGDKPSSHPISAPSPLSGLPEISRLGWGHWFTLRDLEVATDRFSKQNVIGEGGYGIVYQGQLVNGTPVAIKRLLNNL